MRTVTWFDTVPAIETVTYTVLAPLRLLLQRDESLRATNTADHPDHLPPRPRLHLPALPRPACATSVGQTRGDNDRLERRAPTTTIPLKRSNLPQHAPARHGPRHHLGRRPAYPTNRSTIPQHHGLKAKWNLQESQRARMGRDDCA
jgi:hypothetical protein